MIRAPIVLFTYARPYHVRLTVESLLGNPEVSEHELIVFSDAARTLDKQPAVEVVRAYLKSITGFRLVTIYYREKNFGLAKSIISGLSQVLTAHERVIVLEDDLVTSPYFLAYMNESLDRYATDERIISIHGYVYPIEDQLPDAFFLPGADCWGWGTWRRGWNLFNENGEQLLQELKRLDQIDEFDFHGAYDFSGMLKSQIKGENDSWAIRWHASAYINGKLTLHPGKSFVQNIGHDDSGEHSALTKQYDVQLSEVIPDLSAVEIEPSEQAYGAFKEFYLRNRPGFAHRLLGTVKRYVRKYSK